MENTHDNSKVRFDSHVQTEMLYESSSVSKISNTLKTSLDHKNHSSLKPSYNATYKDFSASHGYITRLRQTLDRES